MKTIAVLIDFTEGSKTAMKQALLLAQKLGTSVTCINIAESIEKAAQSEQELQAFISGTDKLGITIKTEVGVGSLFGAIPSVLKKTDPLLVMVCTHGIKGMFQHLFGAHILKLVQAIPFPSIVVQENNQLDFSKIQKILMPLGPHPDFKVKIEQTARFAKLLGAEVILYEIDREGLDTDNLMDKNRSLTKEIFDNSSINYSICLDDLRVVSAGFSRQTLEYALNNQISLISLMSTVSKNEILFGVGDKENFLVNAMGLPILCCNN